MRIQRLRWQRVQAHRSSGAPRGFTLIEVLIAMAVLSLALIAIAGMYPTGYRQVTDAGRMTLASTTGRQILEDIGSVGFANILVFDNWDSQAPAVLPGEAGLIAAQWQANLTPAEGRATVQVEDCGLPGNPCALPVVNPNLRRVTVTVSLTELTQTVQFSTFIANIGM